MVFKINFRGVLTVFSVLLIVAACSAKPAEPLEVKVDLNEFSFKSSQTEFKAGEPYRFIVTNIGTVEHEFMISPPAGQGMSEMDHNGHTGLLMIPKEDLPAGGTKTVDFTFDKDTAGNQLEFACHVHGHYEAGMKLPVVVK